ncbi:ABC transporter permease [Dactylosporangium sp. NPDC051484]|uniref:ABC transporter permease n=1 Tax=Dactylosporangium sp. NPDC051484 TaxID=3154942 RepID=UPI00344C5AC6
MVAELTTSGDPGQNSRGNPLLTRVRPAHQFMRRPLVTLVGQRVALAVPLLMLVSALSYLLVSLTPGDAAVSILGPTAPPEAYDNLRHTLGLNEPVYKQYGHWLGQALQGDLGRSLFSGQAVSEMIVQRLPVTLWLIGGALLVSLIAGVGLGMLSVTGRFGLGRLADLVAVIGFAMPAFWIGVELVAIFAVKLRWLPAIGYVSPEQSLTGWLRSLILPVTALSLHGIAVLAKQTREALLDVLNSEFVHDARSNGIPERSILFRHAFKNIAPRIATVLGVQAVVMLGGSVLVENVYALPGLGSLIVSAAVQHDLPLVQGVAVCFTIFVVVINLLIDFICMALNPRSATW